MYRYVAIVIILMILKLVKAAPPRGPVRLTIDCGSDDKFPLLGRQHSKTKSTSRNSFDIDSFCSLIHSAIPKAVEDGHFMLDEMDDQEGFGNALVPISVAPPSGFVPKYPKIKTPRLKIPKINVPKLGQTDRKFMAPKVGPPTMVFSSSSLFREAEEEETSAEKMEKFKKGVQKLLHVVKVLGKVDQYLSERTRILVEKLAKTFAD